MLSCLLLLGCSSSSPSGPQLQTPSGLSAVELMAKVREVYREAKSYTDNATVVEHAVVRATGAEREIPYTRTSLAFTRPNKLRINFQEAVSSSQGQVKYEVASDGTIVRSSASQLPKQVHEAIAPLELSKENFIPEPELRDVLLAVSIENAFPQLALLLTSDSEQLVFPAEENLRLLTEGKIDGKSYYRLAMQSSTGLRTLWIDQETFTLRRMELPIDGQMDQLNPGGRLSKLSIRVEFEDVTLDSEIDASTFVMVVPEGVRRVRRFVPSPPIGPPSFFGKPVGDYAFVSLDGEEVTPATLEGKVTVLDFWSTRCPPCRTQTPVLTKVYEHFKASEDVAFYAVSTDPRTVPNEVVEKTLKSWGGEMPVLRDLKSTGYHKLNVQQTPTLVLVDRDGKLQAFQAGMHRTPEPMIKVIQQLVDGEDLVAVAREKHAEQLAQHEQALAAATIGQSIVEVEIARPEIAPQKLPENLQLKQLWQTSTELVSRPGDVQLSEDGQSVLVLDGGQAIVELSAAGKLVGQHALPEHQEQAGGLLRTWSNSAGKRLVLASGVGWQQVYVLDENWELVLSFPDERHSGVGDVLLADLTDSGTPVMHVGYWGGLGVQGGSLDGRRLWSNRRLDHVIQLGLGPVAADGKQTLWCSSTRGTLMQLASNGKPIRELYVAGQSLMHFATSSAEESYCGLSVGKVGEYTAVGFDAEGELQWEYPLPPGEYIEQVPRIQSVQLPGGEDCWLVAAADGSLHWIDSEGEGIARFDCGGVLTGVAMGVWEDQTVLLVATADALTAWQVSVAEED